ncbi:MAG: phosphatase PAP2 family protein, partial [Saccharothrix sp.]|nr:phosphatase PAP2 family protein [Saccharothrix sp.]
SRVRTRVHWPSDVLGGLALGAAVAWVVREVVHRRTP